MFEGSRNLTCPLLAQSVHAELGRTCPLLGVKRTWLLHCICLLLAQSGHSVCPLSLKSGLFEDQNNQFFLCTFQRLKSASESEKVSAMPSAVSRSAGPSGTHMKRGEREASKVPSNGTCEDKKPAAESAFCCAGTVVVASAVIARKWPAFATTELAASATRQLHRQSRQGQ